MVFMIRSAFVATGLALVVVSATALSQQPSPQPVPTDPGALTPGVAHQVTLHLGDSVVVDGVPIGCQVTRRNQRVVIECGRTGAVAGTYMAIVGKRTLKVAHLRSAKTAKIILTATNGGGWRACGMPTRAAVSGGSGCR